MKVDKGLNINIGYVIISDLSEKNMSPRPELFFDKLRGAILSQAGPESSYAEDLRKKAQDALNERRYGDVTKNSETLSRLQNLPGSLSELQQMFNGVMKEYGIQDIDIPESAMGLIQKADTLHIEEREAGKRGRKEAKWQTKDSQPKAMLELVKLDKDGRNYVHPNNISIASVIVKPEYGQDSNMIHLAAQSIANWKKRQIDALGYDAEKDKARTVRDVFDPLLEADMENNSEAWFEYHEYVIKNYGRMNIRDFREKVLQRNMGRSVRGTQSESPSPTSEKTPSLKKKPGRRGREVETSPFDFKEFLSGPKAPGVEVILCNKLRKDEIVERVEEALGSNNIYDLARKNGWNHPNKDDANNTLVNSCVGASEKRRKELGKMSVSTQEQLELDLLIQTKIIPELTRSTDQRRVISRTINNSEYEGLKFLNAVAGQASRRPDISDGIVRALYPNPNKYELEGMKRYD